MSSFPISVTQVQVESHLFPPFVKAPGSKGIFFLGGAGVRGVDIEGKFRKYTVIGVYLEDCAIPSLAPKWKGKTAEELMDSVEFFRDIVTGPFEKFTRVTMILPLTGQQYAGKVAENCIAYWKEVGSYSDADEKAIEKLLEIFRDENFPPDASVLFTQSPLGSFTISFSKDSSIPEVGNVVIENKPLSEAVLESIIGKKGVSPAARKSLAVRLSDLLNEFDSVIADQKKLEASETVAVIEAPETKKVLNGVEALVHKEVNGATVIEAPEEKKVLNGGSHGA